MNSPMSVIYFYHPREQSLFTVAVVSTLAAPSPSTLGSKINSVISRHVTRSLSIVSKCLQIVVLL